MSEPIRLNLGCGPTRFPGFYNIDSNPAYKPDLVLDVSQLESHFEPNSITEIVAYDIIEHFDRTQFPGVLKLWYDLLIPGGILLLRTNDIDRLVKLYFVSSYFDIATIMDAELFVWHLMSEHETPGMGHKWAFNKGMITKALVNAGFRNFEYISDKDITAGKYPHATQSDHTNLVIKAIK